VQRRADYFPDPLRFAPERWLDGPPPPPGAYFPFAAGPRMCIGERFAMLEGVLVLAAIARSWQVLPEVERPRLDARFTLRPHGGLPAQVRAA
jgi:cytochrome P450